MPQSTQPTLNTGSIATVNNRYRKRRRAGLCVVDRDLRLCLVLRCKPYDDLDEQLAASESEECAMLKYIFHHTKDDSYDEKCDGVTTIVDTKSLITTLERPILAAGDDPGDIDAKHKTISFLVPCKERLQLPRGIVEDKEEPIFTAAREFFEEGRCANRDINILNAPFKLCWEDAGVRWCYDIYVAVLQDEFSVARFTSSITNKNITGGSGSGDNGITDRFNTAYSIELGIPNSRATIKGAGYPLGNNVENDNKFVVFLHMADYFAYLSRAQTPLYKRSNYNVFESAVVRRLRQLNYYIQRPDRCVVTKFHLPVSDSVVVCHLYASS